MQKRFKNIKKLEVMIGIVGVSYFFILTICAVILIRFLVANSLSILQTEESKKPLPPSYNIDLAESLLK